MPPWKRRLSGLAAPSSSPLSSSDTPLERQEKLLAARPEARKIPAVFYPKDEFTEAKGKDGETLARGIPWQFYLYTEGLRIVDGMAVAGTGKWVLKDLTNPKEPTLEAPIGKVDAAFLAKGMARDPPWELFTPLDSKHRFSKGTLYLNLPSGKTRPLQIENSWGWTEWLTAIGTALGIGALVLLTAGAATPVVQG